jgi:DNA-dependent RNA polymerase auxiliary subunit epsilon
MTKEIYLEMCPVDQKDDYAENGEPMLCEFIEKILDDHAQKLMGLYNHQEGLTKEKRESLYWESKAAEHATKYVEDIRNSL